MHKVTFGPGGLFALAALVAAVSILSSCGSGAAATSKSPNGSTAKSTPLITWPQPAAITSPAPLSGTQLDATASVAGTFVYAPAAGTQTLSVTFTPTDTMDYTDATASVTIAIDPAVTAKAGPVVYVSETTQDVSTGTFAGVIEAFSLDASSGTLTPLPGSPFSTYSMMGDMELAPNGAFAYALAVNYPAGPCCVGPMSLLVYALDPASGVPTLKQALAVGNSAGVISVHPSGKFIYLTPYTDSSGNTGTGIFSVQSDGTLAFSSFMQSQGGGGVISPDGKFLYSVVPDLPWNWGNNTCLATNWSVSAFSIDSSSGALTAAAGAPVVVQQEECQVGRLPQTLPPIIEPSGKRLFLPDLISSSIAAVGVDPSTGALSLLPGSTSGFAWYSEVADPLGRFLYFGSFTGFSLTGNEASGVLTPLPGGPAQVTPAQSYEQVSGTMAIDPSGSFLFSNWAYFEDGFECCTMDNLVGFQIDPNTGVLTQMVSTPVPLAGLASKVVVAAAR